MLFFMVCKEIVINDLRISLPVGRFLNSSGYKKNIRNNFLKWMIGETAINRHKC